jgi:hypothetical protein
VPGNSHHWEDWTPVTAETTDLLRDDFDQLLNVIAMNNGWVAEIYLASPGGLVGTGMRLVVSWHGPFG